MSRYDLAQGGALNLSGGDYTVVGVVAAVALAALAVGAILLKEVLGAGQGTPRMQDIGRAVQEGASAYLSRQFKTLSGFAVAVFLLLFALPAADLGERVGRSVFFLAGALFSASIGYLGMWLSTRANIRVAAAANEPAGREKAMRIAFRTGGVVGMSTVGLGLFGASLVVLVYAGHAPRVLEGFGFGAALLAMFMRVGGGIFTKAADVGGDLVGKVEAGIPEDDPRNAATIADNVGDNVGDCAGMAADLFESYAVTLVAALILGTAAFGLKGLLFPLIVPAIGVVTAVIGVYVTRARAGEPGLRAINRSFYIAATISAIACTVAAFLYLPRTFSGLAGVTEVDGRPVGELTGNPAVIAAVAVIIGIVLAGIILWLTGYFTGTEHRPVRDVGISSLTGAATVILAGISIGFESAVYTALVIGAAVFGAYLLSGVVTVSLFAVALAGTGLLTTVGVIVAMDTFGPVSDNAQGIAEMSGDVHGEGAQILTELDAVGNTTKAVTKGYAIGSAALAALVLFNAFERELNDKGKAYSFSIGDPAVLIGLLIGGLMVYLFVSLAMEAVGRAGGAVVEEVRRQFREKPGIMEGTEQPEYGTAVGLVTRAAQREMILPSLIPIVFTFVVGLISTQALGGLLIGVIVVGLFVAISMTSGGGAWDNAKKLIEDGAYGGKGSEAHAAAVTGDTVGDPYKDTAGPAINPMIKVANIVALLIIPIIT
jgi:K(+)-stimulated pyrophosphate-energized sodium pump